MSTMNNYRRVKMGKTNQMTKWRFAGDNEVTLSELSPDQSEEDKMVMLMSAEDLRWSRQSCCFLSMRGSGLPHLVTSETMRWKWAKCKFWINLTSPILSPNEVRDAHYKHRLWMDSFQEGLQLRLIQDKLFLNCPSHLRFGGGAEFVATNGLQSIELIEFCLPRSSASWAVVVATKRCK